MDKPLHIIGVVGVLGMNRVARFRLDPRDARTDADYYDVVADDSGTRPAPTPRISIAPVPATANAPHTLHPEA